MAALMPFRDINVHASASQYAFSSPSTPNAPALIVERPSGTLRLSEGKASGVQRISSIAGILGMISLSLDKYIIVITKANPVGKLKGNTVYKVVGTELLSLRERQLKDADEEAYLALLRNVLKASPMYFSYTHDITNSFQRQAEADLSTPLWKRADDRFFWNRFIQSDLIDFRNGGNAKYGLRGEQAGADPFILPVMSGMLEIKNTSVKGKPLTFTLITRKSRFRVGTRYFTRGIDKDGHVANFNETEMIVVLDDSRGASGINGSAGGRDAQVLSYVQTRGSVPVYWAEINTLHYTPSLQIRGVESAQSAAKIHFDEQIRLYGDNYLVNLVNQKGREKRVKDAYEQMVHLLQSGESTEREEGDHKSSEKFTRIEAEQHQSKFDKLHYVYFDFHNETKGLQWHRAQLLMDEIQGGVMKGGYFRSVNMPGSTDRVEVRTRQSAVVRTNCMDCLDRTNVVQSMLGRFILSRMLIDLGYMREGENASDDQAFEHLFRNIWADNADIVSKSYSGTGALKTDFTRTGNRTKQGALNDGLNSATRYVRNNFLDGPRQDAFDLFLGNYLPSSSDVGRDSKFADNRPLAIQSVPYVLGACLFFVLVGSMTRRDETAMIWPLRSFMLACCLVSGASAYFMWSHGTLYVNWPKLNTPPWAHENYQEAYSRASKAPVIGPMLASHKRGKSEIGMGYMEEGKSRTE